MKDETTQNAGEHISFLSYVLGIFKKFFKNVTALIGNDCTTNQFIVTNLKKALIWCVSYRSQLPVQDIIAYEEDVVHKFDMQWLKFASH